MTDTPKHTTARMYAGFHRELRASGVPRGLAESMVATAAASNQLVEVHPDALAAVDATRDNALGKTATTPGGLAAGVVFATDPAPETTVRKTGPKRKGAGPSARERRGLLLDLNIQERPTRTVHFIGPAGADSFLWNRP